MPKACPPCRHRDPGHPPCQHLAKASVKRGPSERPLQRVTHVATRGGGRPPMGHIRSLPVEAPSE
eukprot:6510758-Pyramimonas_sp.AAC.1